MENRGKKGQVSRTGPWSTTPSLQPSVCSHWWGKKTHESKVIIWALDKIRMWVFFFNSETDKVIMGPPKNVEASISSDLFEMQKTPAVDDFQFSHSAVSDSLWPHGLQHDRLPCPSPAPRDYSNSGPSSRWCHPTISSSVIPSSSYLQSFPASGSFQMSQFFLSGGQSIGVSASASVLPMNIQDWFPLGWTGWTSLLSKELWRVFSNTTVQKYQFFSTQLSL